MARRLGRSIGGRLARRMVRMERVLVRTAMVPVVVLADRRIARSLKRTA